MQNGVWKKHKIHSNTSDHFIELGQKHFQSFSKLSFFQDRFVHFGKFHVSLFAFFSGRLWCISKRYFYSKYIFQKCNKNRSPHEVDKWRICVQHAYILGAQSCVHDVFKFFVKPTFIGQRSKSLNETSYYYIQFNLYC